MSLPPIPNRGARPVETPRKPDETLRPGDERKFSQEELARFQEALGGKAMDRGEPESASSGTDPVHGPSSNPSQLFRRHDEGGQQQQSGRDDRQGKRDRQRDDNKGNEPPSGAADGLLRSLGALPTTDDAKATAEPADARLAELVREVADRVLVNDANGHPEVRIQLKNDVLQGSEVRIAETNGRLDVSFIPSTKDIETFLVDRASELATALGERLHREVRVEVTGNADSAPADGRQRDGSQQDGSGGQGSDHGNDRGNGGSNTGGGR